MKRELMKIIRCPVCNKNLNLSIKEKKGKEIIEGTLRCKKCDIDYAVEKKIPIFSPKINVEERGKVTIILATLNRHEFINRAIEQILAQKYTNWELVVYDSNEDNETEKIVKKYVAKYPNKIIYLHEFGTQLQGFNRALEVSEGEFVTYFNDDDKWYPDMLEECIKLLENDSDIDFVWSNFDVIDENDNYLRHGNTYYPEHEIRERLFRRFIASWVCFCVRRNALEKVKGKYGFYVNEEKLKMLVDWDLNLRLSVFAEFKHIKKTLGAHRIHSNQGYNTDRCRDDEERVKMLIKKGEYGFLEKGPLINLIMTTYNSEKWLEKAINSCLIQTYQNILLIIVDDGSTDSTKEILKRYEKNKKVQIKYNEHVGMAGVRNIALSLCKGKYIMFSDSDDLITNVRVETLYNIITENNIEFVTTSWLTMDEKDAITGKGYMPPTERHELFIQCLLLFAGGLYKRENFGIFDEGLPVYHDWQKMNEILCRGDYIVVEKPYYLRRIHAKQESGLFLGEKQVEILKFRRKIWHRFRAEIPDERWNSLNTGIKCDLCGRIGEFYEFDEESNICKICSGAKS